MNSADAITEIIEGMEERSAEISHQRGFDVSNKRSMAAHILTWHGRSRVENEYKFVVKWRRDELINSHDDLHRRMA